LKVTNQLIDINQHSYANTDHYQLLSSKSIIILITKWGIRLTQAEQNSAHCKAFVNTLEFEDVSGIDEYLEVNFSKGFLIWPSEKLSTGKRIEGNEYDMALIESICVIFSIRAGRKYTSTLKDTYTRTQTYTHLCYE